MISQTRWLSAPSAINRSPTWALMVRFLPRRCPGRTATSRPLPSSPPAPPGSWGRGHRLAGRWARRGDPATLTPRGWRAGGSARRTMIPAARVEAWSMRAVDPRLLRHAGAARGYLAVVVLLGLTVTALVLDRKSTRLNSSHLGI